MDASATQDVTFSFIVPVFNEQEGLNRFYDRLTAVATGLGEPYEIVFIDDGSVDETGALLRRLAAEDPHVRAVQFARNFGHQLAVTAGYDYASGRAVIALDGDCQHPPELIPELVAHWREGFEVIYTVRRDTEGINPLRRKMGRWMYGLIRLSSGVELTDQADFRLLDRRAVDVLKRCREHARFVRGLVREIGFRQIAVPYTAERRTEGASSYTLKQLMGMATAGIFNFSLKPLRLAWPVGGALLAIALLYAVASLLLWPLGIHAAWWVHLIVAMAGFSGVQILFLAVLGEYVGRSFEETRGRPLYIVRETVGFTETPVPVVEAESENNEESEDGIRFYT